MTANKTIRLIAHNVDETKEIATKVAKKLCGGEVLELIADLGGGKTTFASALIAALGSDEHVSSPTFTLSHMYTRGRLPVYHGDFYRLHDGGILREDVHEVLSDKKTVLVIEWGGAVADVLPEERVTITLQATGEQRREVTLRAPQSLAYVIEDLAL